MNTSYELQLGEQTQRRKLLLKLMFYILILLLLFVVSVCFYVTQPLFGHSTKQSTVSVSPQRLEAHVRMLSESLAPRDYSHLENLERAAAYIRKEFEQARGQVHDQPFQVNGNTYRNVVAFFGPETKERIVVGAHYDTAGPRPGADDNASGVAGLIELAYLLSDANLSIQIELVAYTLEEPPFFRTNDMGSAVHARSLKDSGANIRVMFSLEMIGYFSDQNGSQTFPNPILSLFYPSTGNFISVVGSLGEGILVRRVKRAMSEISALPVYSINAPRFIPGVDFSDHLNYWNEGFDAVMITDTAFYRNHNYHTEMDTAEKLDYKRMAHVIEGVFAAIEALSK